MTDEEVEGDEILGCSKDGNARSLTSQQIANLGGGTGSGITRELNRAFSSELLFDKNEIEGELYVQDDDLTFTVAESGNLADQWNVYGQRITTDGVHGIFFEGFAHVSNITNGEVLEAGTYQFIFWFSNGIARASLMLPSQQAFNLPTLATPTNFVAVPGAGDPETEVDTSSDAVPNATSYELDFSTVGLSGPWTNIPTATGASFTHTGRTPGTTYYYRKRAIATGYNPSQYATGVATTENAGDMTAPTFVFSPADSETDIAVNQEVTITASAPLRDQDGATAITNANITDYVSAVDGDMNPVDISASTIDAAKTIFTIKTPSGALPPLEDITLTIDGVESSVNGVHAVSDNATFSTSNFTIMQGNLLSLGSQLDSILTGADKNFEIEFEFEDIVLSGYRGLASKHNIGNQQVSLLWATDEDSIEFKYYVRESSVGFSSRKVVYPDALDGVTSGKLTLKYFGAIDTNNGLDRVQLFIDDVEVTAGKSLSVEDGVSTWPWNMGNSTAPFVLGGMTFRKIRNFKVRNNMGATTVVDIPIIRTGVDVSGNSFDGTWS